MAGKFALIIGNSRYDDASLGRLKAPDIDVHELESVLKAPEVGHFDDVATLLNQDCASVRKAKFSRHFAVSRSSCAKETLSRPHFTPS